MKENLADNQFHEVMKNKNIKMSEKEKAEKKKGDLNFKKWLLTLSSIGNLILGGLLLIMGISAMRFKLDAIFVADKGLIVLSIIIIVSSICCFIGLATHSFVILLIVFYNYVLTIVFLSVFALGAVSMNSNLIDWIDTHWDIIRASVHNYDMNKFKEHVTTEINSLGIFSLTLIAIVFVSMACITNFLKIKNIIFVLSGPINLIFSCLSFGLIVIGFYIYQNAFYGYIPRWSCVLIIILGFLFFVIGLFGRFATNKIDKKPLLLHLISLSLCFIGSVIATIGIFNIKAVVVNNLDKHWNEVYKQLSNEGYSVRKSYLVNQLQIQLKLTGFYLISFMVFSGIAFYFSLYQYHNFGEIYKNIRTDPNYYSSYLSKDYWSKNNNQRMN